MAVTYTNSILVYDSGKYRKIQSDDKLVMGGDFQAANIKALGNLSVDGDLVVQGTIISEGSTNVSSGQSFVNLNAGSSVTADPKTGGTVVTTKAYGTATTAVSFTEADGVGSLATIVVADAFVFSGFGIIQVSGTENDLNDGLYCIYSIDVDTNTLSLKSVGSAYDLEGFVKFCNNQVTTQTSGGTVVEVEVSVMAVSDGTFLDGNLNPIPQGVWCWNVGHFSGALSAYWRSLDASNIIGLQQAYNVGQTINMTTAKGPLLIQPDGSDLVGFALLASANSDIYTNTGTLNIGTSGGGTTALKGDVLLPDGYAGRLLTPYDTGTVTQYSVVAWDNATEQLLAADNTMADVIPVGVYYQNGRVFATPGQLVQTRFIGTEPLIGQTMYLSPTSGCAQVTAPNDNRVFILGVVANAADLDNALVEITWAPQYVVDLA